MTATRVLIVDDEPSVRRGGVTDDERGRHDLQNQLAIVQGFADLLLSDTPPDDPRRKDLEEIHKAAGTALEMLARLFARSVASRQEGGVASLPS